MFKRWKRKRLRRKIEALKTEVVELDVARNVYRSSYYDDRYIAARVKLATAQHDYDSL